MNLLCDADRGDILLLSPSFLVKHLIPSQREHKQKS